MASSSDEGEIIEVGVGNLKASSLPHAKGSGVDRQDRLRDRFSSPEYDSASRYSNSSRRSRSPRGYKRPRDDRDSYPTKARDGDLRQSRGHYEDRRRDEYKRSRVSYDDIDRPRSRSPNNNNSNSHDWRHGERNRNRSRDLDRNRERGRDRYTDRPSRARSPSPHRSRRRDDRFGDRFVREGQTDRRDGASRELRYSDDASSSKHATASKRTIVGEASQIRSHNAKPQKGSNNVPSSNIQSKSRWVIPMIRVYNERCS